MPEILALKPSLRDLFQFLFGIQFRFFNDGFQKLMEEGAHFAAGFHAHGGEVIAGERQFFEAGAFSSCFDTFEFPADFGEIGSENLLKANFLSMA